MIAAVVAVVVIALVLDRQDTDHPPRAAASAPATLTAGDIARIVRRVERLRDLRFERPVKPLFVGREEAVRIEQGGSVNDYPASKQHADEESLKLLGLMRPRDSVGGALSAIEREQVLGFYDPKRKRLVVVKERSASRALLEITLAHELVHALEDQRFGLRENADPNDDAALAESALAEGTATTVMAEYAVRYFGIDDALSLFDSAAGTETKLPKYIEDALLFPYEQGIAFVEAFRDGSRSWKALDKVIRLRRPATAEQVIHPSKYAAGEVPVAIGLPDLGGVLGKDWQALGSSSVGEFDLREIFRILGGSRDDEAAAGWGGGRFELWQRGNASGCEAPCVARDVGLMVLAWDTTADRADADRAFARAFRHGLGARSLGRRAGVLLWSSRGGVIAMHSAAKRTAIVLAPSPRTAARVLVSRARIIARSQVRRRTGGNTLFLRPGVYVP